MPVRLPGWQGSALHSRLQELPRISSMNAPLRGVTRRKVYNRDNSKAASQWSTRKAAISSNCAGAAHPAGATGRVVMRHRQSNDIESRLDMEAMTQRSKTDGGIWMTALGAAFHSLFRSKRNSVSKSS